jgi:hypothetical protein
VSPLERHQRTTEREKDIEWARGASPEAVAAYVGNLKRQLANAHSPCIGCSIRTAERNQWIRAFNRLEKAASSHAQNCLDADGLDHARRAVLKDLTAGAAGPLALDDNQPEERR